MGSTIKAKLIGLYGGFTTSKNTGRHFLAILSPGPKVDKVELPSAPVIPPTVEFGSKIEITLANAEQKFSDYNSSFSVASSASIALIKWHSIRS